jgi:mRNA interferase RelE/StbE
MTYTLLIEPTARKQMKSLPQRTQKQIRSKLDLLCEAPRQAGLDVKKLQGRDGYRLRVGDYRVIYTLDDGRLIVRVIDVGHRQGIY